MRSVISHRIVSGCLVRFRVCNCALVVLGLLLPVAAVAQQPNAVQKPAVQIGQAAVAVPATPLSALVKEAEGNNPEIAAAYHGWQAATQVPRQASALPETQLVVQQFSVGSPRPFAGFSNSDFAYIGFGASQDLPYPGKRALRGKVAELEADSMREDAQAVRRRVLEALKIAYFQLAYVQQTLGIIRQSDQTLSQVEQIAESRYRVGQGNQQDVLKAQLQHTKILQAIATNHGEEGQLQAQLKQILNRPQTSPDIVAEPLTASVLPYTDAQLLRAEDQSPEIQARQQLLASRQSQIELAHKDFRPDFVASYMYQHTASQFRDYYMATFGIRLPNRGRQKAELAEAVEGRERARQELQAERQRVRSEIEQQYVLARTAEEQLKIYKDGLIPQANATFRAGMAAYQANRQDFETLLGNFLDVLNLNLDYRRQQAEHESALARLERLTGVTLP